MSKNLVHDLIVPREITTRDGEIITRWIKIGIATETDRGLLCSIDSITVGDWDHTFHIYPRDRYAKPSTPKQADKPCLVAPKTPSKVIRQQILTDLGSGITDRNALFGAVMHMHPDVKANRIQGVFGYMERKEVVWRNGNAVGIRQQETKEEK